MPAAPDRGDDSFEVDRHVDDQPVRDDLIEPDDIDPARVDEPTMDEEVGVLPDPEELPESQGASALDAERLTEDAKDGPRLSDELAEDEHVADEMSDPVEQIPVDGLDPADPTGTP